MSQLLTVACLAACPPVDAVRVHVGFEEDLDARVRSLEQAFIMSQRE